MNKAEQMIGDKAYLALRNKLNCLHYCQPLSKESCALAERLLGDLLATTELYQRSKARAEQAEAQISKEQIALQPLKKENARVVKENNALHKEIIQVKENLSQNDNNWQRQFKQLESEYNDIKQAFNQKNYRIKELEKRNLKLEERLDTVMTKIYKPESREIISAMVPPTEDNETGAKQNMELTYVLEKETNREIKDHEEEDLINQMVAADERVQVMTKELNAYKQFKTDAEDRIKELETMVQERDREINRLNSLYMGADNLDKMHIEFTEKENSNTISKLNAQLDYINKENNRLHKTIDDLRIKNKGNTGMYFENRKVCDRNESLKKTNDDLRRRLEDAQKTILDLKEKEAELITTMHQDHISKDKYAQALQTIEYQQKDIDKLKKYFEVKDNQAKLQTHMMMGSQKQEEGADNIPERDKPSPVEMAKLTKEKERLQKKNEQFRNEINALSGKYISKCQVLFIFNAFILPNTTLIFVLLGSQRKLESYEGEYKDLQIRLNDLETGNQVLREELMQKEKEIQVMVEYLKQAQPMELKGKEIEDDVASFGGKKNSGRNKENDPEKTNKMYKDMVSFV